MHAEMFTETLDHNERLAHRIPTTAPQEKNAHVSHVSYQAAGEHVEQLARQALTEHRPAAFYFKHITVHFAEGVLTVRGRVPTFRLKQVLQFRLGHLEGVARFDNQVDVVSATGLSSVRAK